MFGDSGNMKRHVKHVHEKVRVECHLCGKQEHDKGNLSRHIKEKHSAILTCDTCGLQYQTIYGLKKHINKEHKEVPTVYVCKTCGMEFLSPQDRQRHLFQDHNRHTISKRQIKCYFCPDLFATNGERNKHLESTHADVSLKYKCELCPRSSKAVGFKLQSRLEVHKTLVHKIIKIEENKEENLTNVNNGEPKNA